MNVPLQSFAYYGGIDYNFFDFNVIYMAYIINIHIMIHNEYLNPNIANT